MKKLIGFTLLEFLIALAILSISLLGLMKMQTMLLQSAYAALLHAQAQTQLTNFIRLTEVTEAADRSAWSKSNQNYLPQSISRYEQTQASLQWQAYGQTEILSLPTWN